MESIEKLIEAVVPLIKLTAAIYKEFLDSGLPENVALELTKDFLKMSLDNSRKDNLDQSLLLNLGGTKHGN